MNLYSRTQSNSHEGSSGDVIVFNLIRSSRKRQTKALPAEVMMPLCDAISRIHV